MVMAQTTGSLFFALLCVFALFAQFSHTQSTAATSNTLTPTVTTCTSCLLEAFNPSTLTYPGAVQGNKTITAATVLATPYIDAEGRTISIHYETIFKTQVESLFSNNSSTTLFSATWTTLGTTLTWPTTYVAYSNFGIAPKCTGSTTALNIPQSTDPARLIFPLSEDLESVSNSVVEYLDTLHVTSNGTDLSDCSWAVSKTNLARRGNSPISVGRRAAPLWRRVGNSTANIVPLNLHPPSNNATNVTSPDNTRVPPSPTSTTIASFESPEPSPVDKVTAVVLTDTQFQKPITVATSGPAPPGKGDSTTGSNDGTSRNTGNSGNGGATSQGTTGSNAQGQDTNNGPTQNSQGQGQGNNVGDNIVNVITGNSNSNGQNSGSAAGSSPQAQTNSGSNGSPQVVNVGGGEVTVAPASYNNGNNGGGVVVAGQTLNPGQTATVNGVAVSVPSSGGNIVIGGSSTVTVNGANAASPAASALTFGGSIVTADTSGAFSIAPGVVVSAGGSAATVGGTVISIASGGSLAIVNGATQTLGPSPTAPVITVNGIPITGSVSGSSTAFVLAPGQTLTPGGVVTLSGTTFSLQSSGSAVVVNGQTSVLGSSNPSITAPPVLTVNGNRVTASVSNGKTSFVLGPGTTLTPGGSVVVSGTTFSLPSTGSEVIINGKTSTLGRGDSGITAAPALTIGGRTYQATVSDGKTVYDLGSGTTLTAGGVITVDGTRISLASDGSSLIFGTSVSKISGQPKSTSATTTHSPSAKTGDAIASGLGTTKKGSAYQLSARQPWAWGLFLLQGSIFLML